VKEPNAPCARPTCTAPEGFGPAIQAAAGGQAAAGSAAASAASPAASAAPRAAAAATSAKPAAAAAAAATSPKPAAAASTASAAPSRRRQRRQATSWEHDNAGIIDVQSQYVSMLDIENNVRQHILVFCSSLLFRFRSILRHAAYQHNGKENSFTGRLPSILRRAYA
jgi:pyruvate/2-oxoglutarate dehydrogenase complex dihydrolipoamide acyltransferase (E2) component